MDKGNKGNKGDKEDKGAKDKQAALSYTEPWSTPSVSDSAISNLNPSEISKKELEENKDQLDSDFGTTANMEKKKMVSSSSSNEDQLNSTVPTDLTISGITPSPPEDLRTTSCTVIYDTPKTTCESISSDNLIPEYKKTVSSQDQSQRKTVKGAPSSRENEKRLAKMKADFDDIPPLQPVISQLKKEFTKNRIESHKKICELNAEVAVKSKETEFLEFQLARNHTDLKVAKSEVATKESENRRLREEISEIEGKSSHKILELTLALQEKTSKLDAYQQLYSKMDEMTYVDSVNPERMPVDDLSSYVPSGKAMSIPDNLKYKLQQSMDLGQRLKEERDHLERRRDEADRKLREMEIKYQGALIELNKLKIGEDTKLTNAKAQVQLKCFELERVQMILEDYKQKHKTAVDENEALKKKIELLTHDMNESTNELRLEVTRLTLELQSKSSRLELYEHIENTLDELILQAAEVPDANIGKDIVSFCSSGPHVPTDSRRRLLQAFDLAKKNCELEKTVAEQREEIMSLYDRREELRQEVEDVKALNGYSVGQLVETITEKNREIGRLNSHIKSLEQDSCEVKQSRDVLQNTVDSLKGYQNQVFQLYRSSARANQAKSDRAQVSVAENAPIRQANIKYANSLASSKSSLHRSDRARATLEENAPIRQSNIKDANSVDSSKSSLHGSDRSRVTLAQNAPIRQSSIKETNSIASSKSSLHRSDRSQVTLAENAPIRQSSIKDPNSIASSKSSLHRSDRSRVTLAESVQVIPESSNDDAKLGVSSKSSLHLASRGSSAKSSRTQVILAKDIPTRKSSVTNNNLIAASRSSLLARSSIGSLSKDSLPTVRPSTSWEARKIIAALDYEDVISGSYTASTRSLTSSTSHLMLGPTPAVTDLHTIAEESDDDTYSFDSIIVSSTPPSFHGTPSSSTPSLTKKIRNESSTSSSSKQYKPRGSKPIPCRQVVSSDLIAEHTREEEKPVALKLSKVKPSSSDLF